MKNLKKIFCLILVLVMSFGTSVNIFAASTEEKYVSDIKIGYGEDGKNALIANGYKVDSSFNANDSGRGDSVWIGFKTTSNPLDAITDVAVMNMNGDYTFSGWGEEYESLMKQVSSMLSDFMAGVEEFRTNYKAGSPYAQAALDVMNYLKDTSGNTETDKENGYTGKLIGDLLKSENTSSAAIQNVFMKGNYQFVTLVKQAIAVACTEWKDANNTFVTRLNSNGYFTGTVDPSYNHERELVSKAISNLKPDIEDAESKKEEYYKSYSLVKEDYVLETSEIPEGTTGAALDALQFENYIKKTCTEDEQSEYFSYENLIEILKGITIKPETKNVAGEITRERESFYDIIKKDETELTENDFETIRLAMTAGQLGVLSTVGFPFLLACEEGIKTSNFSERFYDAIDEFEEEYGTEKISVYYGVDLAAYDDPTNTAMTGSAHTELKAGETSNFGVDADKMGTKMEAWVNSLSMGLCVVSAVIGILSLITWISMTWGMTAETIAMNAGFILGAKIIFFVSLVVFITFAILFFISKKEKVIEPDDITYTKIPKCIVDVKTKHVDGVGDEKIYYTYTCAKRIDAVDSDNTMLVYGDLNGYNKKNEWVAVYYTKNRDLGNPITASVLSSASSEAKTGYLAIHDFGTSGAANLNRYNSGINRKALYGFIKTTTFDDEEQQMSVFGNGTATLYLVSSFAAGAFISGLAVHGFTKKKYRKAQ